MTISIDKLNGINENLDDILTDEDIIDALAIEDITTIRDVLIKEGILTIENLANRGKREIIFIFRDYHIPASKALELHEQAENFYNEICGFSFGVTQGKTLSLSTGCPSFDKILEGGFETGNLYEIYGKSDSGKSLLLEQLICMSHFPVGDGGLDTPAIIYIDTKDGYKSTRLRTIAKNLGINTTTISKKVKRYIPKTTGALLYFCKKQLHNIMIETSAKLVILNDLATQFRSEYGSDLNRFHERQHKALNVVTNLIEIAKKFDAIVLMTNQTVPGGGHAMSNTVGHESPMRIRIEPYERNIKKITIEKSINLPEDSCFLEKT